MDTVSDVKEISDQQEWNYYNYAMIPKSFPHEEVDTTKIKTGEIWKNKKALFARWTSDFDCQEETSWWYVITKDVFDISALKSKRRNVVAKGIKNFYVKRIDPKDYLEDLYKVYLDAMSGYPEKSRHITPFDRFSASMMNLSKESDVQHIYAAFFCETDELCGYTHVPVHKDWAALSAMKAKPQFEKYQVNAAMVYGVLEALKDRMDGRYYICDGARNVLHETKFQDYLEKYFMFRKAYCHLHIQYRPMVKPFIGILYLFRKILKKFDHISIVHKINGVIIMEEIIRNDGPTMDHSRR